MGMTLEDLLFDIVYDAYQASKGRVKFSEIKLKTLKILKERKVAFDEDDIGFEIAEILDEITSD